MITEPTYSARILGTPDVPVSMRDDAGRITLDAGNAPHVEASVTLTVEDTALLADLDPRDSRRLVIDVAGRSFDLGIREASPDRSGATVQVQLASDEALLGDFAQLVDDNGPRAHQASLRGVVNYVLDEIGAALEPGTLDADVTPFWEVNNLLANPSLETNAANWLQVGGSPTLARVAMTTPAAPAGAYALRLTCTTAGIANAAPVAALNDFSVTPGKWYVLAADVCSNVSREAFAVFQWRNANGTVIVSSSLGQIVTTTSAEFRRVHIIAQAPAGATHVLPYVQFQGNVVGNQHFIDAAMFYEGTEVVPYFDGSSTGGGYTYEWLDVAHASASKRIPDIERSPESLLWSAGVSGLAFLAPLVQAAGLRLVCNERREWTLRDAGYREPGAQTFRYGVNIITVSEQLSRAAEEWFDGAVYRYRWTDRDGIEQIRDDAYALTSTPSKVILREINAPYPGPGRAAYAVQRAQGKGRTVTATKQATWLEAAEQPFSAILDGTPIQVGTAEKVEFDLATNEVTTTSRTTDTPAGAIVLLAGTINALTGTINNL